MGILVDVCLVVQFFHETFVQRSAFLLQHIAFGLVVSVETAFLVSIIIRRIRSEVAVADVTVVDGDVGSTKDRTALSSGVGITLYGRNTVEEGCTLFYFAHNNMRFCGGVCYTHMTFPSATEDVTCSTASDVGIGAGCEIGHTEVRMYTTRRAGCVQVGLYNTTEQGYIGGSPNVTAIRLG